MVLPRDVAPPFPLAEVSLGKCHPNRHCPVAPGHVPAPRSAAALMLLWCDPHGRETSGLGGLWDPQRGSVSAQTWTSQPLDHPLVTPWPLPLKITLEDQALPPRQGPSRAKRAPLWAIQDGLGETLVVSHLCPCQSWLLCQGRWQLQTPGGHSPEVSMAEDQHLCPTLASISQPWALL